jgi:chemotaxis protein MotB
MIRKTFFLALFSFALLMTSCVSKKQFMALQTELETTNQDLGKCGEDLNDYMNRLSACQQDKTRLEGEINTLKNSVKLREEQVNSLKDQVNDYRALRDKQLNQVGDLTVLSQSANENIKETLSQLEKKDKYIRFLQLAKSKADSINLALAVNLKSVLRDGIEDDDVEVKVDKTVVFINLSDKMLYESGSSKITSRANEVLSKIAQIVKSRPELDVMVEGYTDNVPIKNDCVQDNWDLSVKRATSVVRALQENFNVDPNRLIAAGRGEYNTLASNDTSEGRSMNRRTRIIILPKLNQFYDLLNPEKVPN